MRRVRLLRRSMSLIPDVERVPLALGALALAVRDERLSQGFVATTPKDRAAWQTRIARSTTPALGSDWATSLNDAFAATGAAAVRLARVRDSQGVVVTTGQQPGLFGGPLYTLAKALSALALADRLEQVTGVATAPVFWAATDDADFHEGATTWFPSGGVLTSARVERAPADGTMMSHAPLHDVSVALRTLRTAAAGAAWPDWLHAAEVAYRDHSTVGDAYVALMRRMLEPLGIAVLDASHPSVRRAAAPLLRHALTHAAVIDQAVTARSEALRAAGYRPQVDLVADRSLVFRVKDGVKQRLPLRAAADAASRLGDEDMSPNVLLRPVVERALLPTVAYLAGPGELAYFAQVGAVSSALDFEVPLALPRTSMRVVPHEIRATLSGLGQSVDGLRDTIALQRALAAEATAPVAMDAITALRVQLEHSAAKIRGSESALDARALDGAVAQIGHRVERLERRMLAASKRTIHDHLQRLARAQALLWPHGGPQERTINPIPWLARFGTPLLDRMQSACAEGAAAQVHAEH
jgi:bacillithiol synthase